MKLTKKTIKISFSIPNTIKLKVMIVTNTKTLVIGLVELFD
jgi:hypothetical protein